ncbi:MAG: hypothetical protein QM733_14475 [Ilumatobacteraceae bacterium]
MLWPWHTDLELTIGDVASDVSRVGRARVVLDVGRDGAGPLDVQLAQAAIASGAVIVTDDPDPPPPLVPGQHLLVAPVEHLAEQAVALAADEPRRAAIAAAAADVTIRPGVLPPAAVRRPAPSALRRMRRAVSRALGPDVDRQRAESEHLDLLVAEAKAAYLAQVDHRRALETALIQRSPALTHTPAWIDREPAVSVVVPMHRDAAAAATAAAAAFERAGIDGEVVAVGRAADSLIAALPWLPAAAVTATRPLGPGEIVDLGVETSRGRHLIVLEPGEQLYPNAVAALLGALDGQPGAVVGAFGITALTLDGAAVGVCGHVDWSVDLLVRERVFDTVALIRRDAWSRLGAAPATALLDGWQRTDRHLGLAESGSRLAAARCVVASRPTDGAPAWLEAIDPTRPWLSLFERHPRLPWPS